MHTSTSFITSNGYINIVGTLKLIAILIFLHDIIFESGRNRTTNLSRQMACRTEGGDTGREIQTVFQHYHMTAVLLCGLTENVTPCAKRLQKVQVWWNTRRKLQKHTTVIFRFHP